MKIYHYTSIETLALILKHQTIRFNRLDMMDDYCEKTFLINQNDWSPYTYVSCWTENPMETMPLWNTYTSGGIGIRIGIDKDFIDWDKQPMSFSVPYRSSHPKHESDDKGTTISVSFTPIRIYRPLSDDACYRHVTYANEERYSKYDKEIGMFNSYMDVNENLMRSYPGVFRKEKWSFQEESRFVLYAVPFSLTDPVVTHNDFIKLIRLNVANNVRYIDVPVKPEKLKHIEVTLGPDVDEAQAIIVKALLQKFAPDATLSVSSLSDNPLWYLI